MRKMQDFLEESGLLSIKILHNNAYRVGDFSICGTRGWFFDATDAQPDKVLLREVQRLKTSIAAGRALGGRTAGVSALSARHTHAALRTHT